MTTTEKLKLINTSGETNAIWPAINSVQFDVYILDVREAYGRIDCLIKPRSGTGEKWVSKETIKFFEKIES